MNHNIKKAFAILAFILFSAAGLFPADKIPVAIMKFEVTNLNASEVNLMIDFFNSALFETGVFDVVQREKRDSLLRELEFSQSDFADQGKTRNIGKLLSVKLLVFGSIGKLGSNVIFNATCVDVETGKTVGTFSNRYRNLDEIVDILPVVSQTFANQAVKTMFVKKATILYYDDFEGDKNWPESDELAYKNGRYAMYPRKSPYHVWEQISVDDFALDVTTDFLGGEKNSGYGVMFRFQDENNYYAYWISKNGYFKVAKWVAGVYSEIVPWTKSSAINENTPNKLRVVAIGSQFSFFINNVKVKDQIDTSFAKGSFGLYVFQNVNAAFDNVLLYQGNLLVFETFKNPGANWSNGDQAYAKDGVYYVKGNGEGYYSWSAEKYTDVSFRAETYWKSGSEQHGYGLIFRFTDVSNHYSFTITKNGFYLFGYYKDGAWTTLVDWKKSPFINTEGKNLLRVECVGDSFSLYINDNLVETIVDATMKSGTIGFVAFKDIIAAFDNVEVFLIE